MSDKRAFHELIKRVGDDCLFQKILIALCCGIFFELSFTTFANTFLFHQDPYRCPPTINNCHHYVCQLP